MRTIRAAVLAVCLAPIVGCEADTITSVYDVKTDSVQCKKWEDGNPIEIWTEKGYVCHYKPETRIRPLENVR